MSANANVTKDLRLVASYSFNDIRYANSNRTEQKYDPYTDWGYGPNVSEKGKPVEQTPRNMFSIFADYSIPSGIFKGLGINWGMRYVGYTYGDEVSSYKVPSYILFDVGARYNFEKVFPTLKGLTAQLSMSNLTNKYYEASCYSNVCYLGEGRKVYGNLAYRW